MSLRTRSTQKLPIVSDWRRTRPRTNAIATEIPTAADTKFCTVSPAICVKMAHRPLAAVVLPVRVRHEADRSVEGERRRHPVHVGRIERQHALDPLEQVEPENRNRAERKQRQGIDGPLLLAPRVDTAEPVEHTLDRQEDTVARVRARRRTPARGTGREAASQPGRARSEPLIWSQAAPVIRAVQARAAPRRDTRARPERARAERRPRPSPARLRIGRTRQADRNRARTRQRARRR